MYDFNQVATLANTLKGSPISCFFVLLLLHQPLSVGDLADATGYHRETIGIGMRKLSRLGLATRLNKTDRWQLTDKGYQLPLPNFNNQENVGNPDILPSSSSILINQSHESESESLKQLQLLKNVGNPDILPDPKRDHLIQVLIYESNTSKIAATKAVDAALRMGKDPIDIEVDILTWVAYCISSKGKNLTPANFIPAKITEGVPCSPKLFKPTGNLAEQIHNLKPPICSFCKENPARFNAKDSDPPICNNCEELQQTSHEESQENLLPRPQQVICSVCEKNPSDPNLLNGPICQECARAGKKVKSRYGSRET